LTSLEAMWLLDLREPPEESHDMSRHEHGTRRFASKRSVTRKPRTRRAVNMKAR